MRYAGFVVTLALAVLGARFPAGSAPTQMTHAAVYMSGTDFPPDSFAARAKIYWRASNQYCRVDEEPDLKNGIHGRLIVNEPDIWLVNLLNNTAKHMVDQGPTFNCRLPIFAFNVELTKGKIGELEFGRELEFFKANGAQAVDGPKLANKTNYYRLTIGDSILLLTELSDIHAPLLIALIRGDNVAEVHYMLSDDNVPFKADLFASPTGVKIEETK
jgi:hypothetical protein